MSLATEWILAVHRAIWFPVLYAMGLERDGIEAPVGGAYISRLETAVVKRAKRATKARRRSTAMRKKAA
jgi:hypothetical protein